MNKRWLGDDEKTSLVRHGDVGPLTQSKDELFLAAGACVPLYQTRTGLKNVVRVAPKQDIQLLATLSNEPRHFAFVVVICHDLRRRRNLTQSRENAKVRKGFCFSLRFSAPLRLCVERGAFDAKPRRRKGSQRFLFFFCDSLRLCASASNRLPSIQSSRPR